MFHPHRLYRIKVMNNFNQVARDLKAHHTHLLCTGYQVKDVVILNDSITEDSLIEFAVLVIAPGTFPYIVTEIIDADAWQTDSLTVSWSNVPRLIRNLRGAAHRDHLSDIGWGTSPTRVWLDYRPKFHNCVHCR